MKKKKVFGISEKDSEILKRGAKTRGISEAEYIRQALKHFATCKKAEKIETMRKITVKYEGKCLQCGRTLKVGQEAWWARDVGLMCEECKTENELEGIGDKTLARLYTRKRKLQKTNKGLKKLNDELADAVNELAQKRNLYDLGERHEEIEKFRMETLKMVEDFFKRKIGTEQETQAIKNIVQRDEEAKQLQKEIREEIRKGLISPLKPRKKKKKEQSPYSQN